MSRLIFFLLTLSLSASLFRADGQTIAGNLAICYGSTSPLTGSPVGGTWSSSNLSVATVSVSGIVVPIATGTTVITYTDPTSATAIAVVTVNPLPSSITGATTMCAGTTIPLGSGSSGGSWISTNTSVATIGSSTGLITGISSGTTLISYAYPTTNCAVNSTITVNAQPGFITTPGSFSFCAGSNISLNNVTSGGSWTSTNPAVASIDAMTGITTGIAAGTALISYTLPTLCTRTRTVTVNNVPAITGTAVLCAGGTTPLGSPTGGGTWSSGSPAVATVNPATGVVSGVSAGLATITYTLVTGCVATVIVTVNATPATITGTTGICIGENTTLSSSTAGGNWTSSNTAIATIEPGMGMVTSVSPGTSRITYTLPSGCYATTTVTITGIPLPISSPSSICMGSPATFSSATSGGIWISSSTAVATVSAGAGSSTTVTGVSAGSATISYVVGPGCVTSTPLVVNPLPYAGVLLGPSVICIGAPAALTASVPGGSWTSSAPAIASVSGIGVVSGFGLGSATIIYSIVGICGTAVATLPVTISLPPAPITGTSELCSGNTTLLTDGSAGGSWSSSDLGIATISSTGSVDGITGGIAMISYSYSSACYATRPVTVNPSPGALIGVAPVCLGSVIALSDALPGGTWSSSNPAIATIATVGASTGVVSGVNAGTAYITYAMSTGCATTATVTVNALPVITASAIPSSCGGTYSAVAGGGMAYSWSPAIGLSCELCSSTTISPTETTTYTVTGTGVLGCINTATVTINGNRIFGNISFSATPPSALSVKVWLIQFNPADSSITATDSIISCLNGVTPYFEFDNKPAGNYMVKAKLQSSIEGSSGYVPTYGASSSTWYGAASISHSAAADSQNITMLYGTVPPGTGFIGGYVYSGAGKGTTGEVAVQGMLIFLKNALTGQVVTYAYTNAVGAYSFSNIALGNYIVYPEDFGYYTTPSDLLTLNEAHPSESAVNFKEHTTLSTITPFRFADGVANVASNTTVGIYPNPSAGNVQVKWQNLAKGNATLVLTDMTGRKVMESGIPISEESGAASIDLSELADGFYFFSINTEKYTYAGKLVLQKQ